MVVSCRKHRGQNTGSFSGIRRVVDPRGALGARPGARPAPDDTTESDRTPKVDSATPGQSGAHSSLTQWRGKAR